MKELIEILKNNNINGYYAENALEAKKIALSLIPDGAQIAMGNSLTLRQTAIYEALESGPYNFINQFEAGITPDENLNRRKKGMLADVYFTSSNALTKMGELVNIDGKGNRVAAMLFGPDKVVIIVGKNKIVNDEKDAWARVQKFVAPNLAKKLGRDTPCAVTGVCLNCQSPQRICRCYTTIKSQMPADKDRIHVIIVNEDLGI